MQTTSENRYRGLDRRSGYGIDVKLLWDPASNSVSLSVDDERRGDAIWIDVASADALDAFNHPYANARAVCDPAEV